VSPTTIVVVDPDGELYSAFEDLAFLGTACELTLTETGPANGDAIEGSFVAQLWEGSSGPLHAVSGRFKTTIQDDEAE